MEFLKNHYEKISIVGALVALLVCCGLFYLSLARVNQRIENLRPKAGTGKMKPIAALDVEREFVGIKAVKDPKTDWELKMRGPGRGTLFDPPQYIWCVNEACRRLLPYEYEVCPYPGCGAKQPSVNADDDGNGNGGNDPNGFPKWYNKQYTFLDPSDPAEKDRDHDGDGFSTWEEFKGGTHPSDPALHPPYSQKLRFLSAARNALPLMLKKVTREGADTTAWTLQFAVVERGRWVTRFSRIKDAELIAGFKLISLQPKVRMVMNQSTKTEMEKDVSELTIQRGNEDPVMLQPEVIAYEHKVKVKFIFLSAAETHLCQIIETQVGKEFSLVIGKGAQETHRTIEALAAAVVVQRVGGAGTSSPVTIQKFQASDMSPSASPAQGATDKDASPSP